MTEAAIRMTEAAMVSSGMMKEIPTATMVEIPLLLAVFSETDLGSDKRLVDRLPAHMQPAIFKFTQSRIRKTALAGM